MKLYQILLCTKLEHSSVETVCMYQKAAAMGTWRLAAASWQRACSCITSCAEFFGETSNHSGDSAPYSPDLVPCNFWLFPKLKSPLKGKRFQTIDEIQENTTGQLMAIGRTVWGPEVPTLKGSEVSLSYVQGFLCLYLLQSMSLFFILRGWIPSGWTSYTHPVLPSLDANALNSSTSLNSQAFCISPHLFSVLCHKRPKEPAFPRIIFLEGHRR